MIEFNPSSKAAKQAKGFRIFTDDFPFRVDRYCKNARYLITKLSRLYRQTSCKISMSKPLLTRVLTVKKESDYWRVIQIACYRVDILSSFPEERDTLGCLIVCDDDLRNQQSASCTTRRVALMLWIHIIG